MKATERIMYVLVWCLLMISTGAVYSQPARVDIKFAGNTKFSDKTLLTEFNKCPYDLTQAVKNDQLSTIVGICLRGTVNSLYGSVGDLDIAKRTDIEVENSGVEAKVTIRLAETPQTYVGAVSFDGDSFRLLSPVTFRKWYAQKRGDVMDLRILRKCFQRVRDYYYDRGYLSVEIDFDLHRHVDPETQRETADIKWTLFEGEQFVISTIQFDNVTPELQLLDEEILRTTLGLTEGDIYSQKKLEIGISKLNKLGRFGKIKSTRQFNVFSGGSAYSQNVDIDEDYDEHKVAIKFRLYPVDLKEEN